MLLIVLPFIPFVVRWENVLTMSFVRMLARSELTQVVGRYTEAERAQFLTQSDKRVFGTSNVNCPSVDGQAAIRNERGRDSNQCA